MTTSLEKVFNQKHPPKKFSVNVQVLDYVSTSKVAIRDNNQKSSILDVRNVHRYMLNYLTKGKFVKIINPVINKEAQELLIENNSVVLLVSDPAK